MIRGERKSERTDDPDRVQAQLAHGVLTVTLPKSEQRERSRRVTIQGGSRSAEKSAPTKVEGERGPPRAKTFQASASPLGGCKVPALNIFPDTGTLRICAPGQAGLVKCVVNR